MRKKGKYKEETEKKMEKKLERETEENTVKNQEQKGKGEKREKGEIQERKRPGRGK